MTKKIPYKQALSMIEQGLLGEDSLKDGIEKGLIAGPKIAGGGKRKEFVSEEQKQFYEDKQKMLSSIKETASNLPQVKQFFQDWGTEWEVDGKTVNLSLNIYVSGFKPCLNSFERE